MNFYEDLNASSWKGIVTEVGLGLEFSANFLAVPGASKTIMEVRCPYDGFDTPEDTKRKVSLKNARRMARVNLEDAMKRDSVQCRLGEFIFGLAITGAHYNGRDSHGWICLVTKEWEAYMHFSIAASKDRAWISRILDSRVQWFLTGCLLSKHPWSKHIEDIGDSLETHNIDVLYAPGVSDAERLLLLRPLNPLAYYGGKFRRVIDCLRLYPEIYPGTFNPPTKHHLESQALFEITQNHYFKGSIAIGDLLDRIYMLDLAGKSTLITQAPMFVDKYRLIVNHFGKSEVTFHLGTDAWNALIAHHQYPTDEWLNEQMPCASFIIHPRDDVTIEENQISKGLTWHIADLNLVGDKIQYADNSSTAVRNCKDPETHDFLTPEVANYIKTRGLYKNE